MAVMKGSINGLPIRWPKMKIIQKHEIENTFVDIALRSHTEKDLSPKERLDRFWMGA